MKPITKYKYYYVDVNLLSVGYVVELLLLLGNQEKTYCIVSCVHDMFEQEKMMKEYPFFQFVYIGDPYQEIQKDLKTRYFSKKQILVISNKSMQSESFKKEGYDVLEVSGTPQQQEQFFKSYIHEQTSIVKRRHTFFILSLILCGLGMVMIEVRNISPSIEIGLVMLFVGMLGGVIFGGTIFLREILDIF